MSADRDFRRRRVVLIRRELRCGVALLAIPGTWIGLSLATAPAGQLHSSLWNGAPLLALVTAGAVAVRLFREWGHLPSRERLLARPVERGEVIAAKFAATGLLVAAAAALFLGALALAPTGEAQSAPPPAPRLGPTGP